MDQKDSLADRLFNIKQLRERRKKADEEKRTDNKGYTMEGLRLGTLLNQLQALQAVQGLQELRPREKGHRFLFPDTTEELIRLRQWLMFKADWLDALLEDTVNELEALNKYEARRSDKKSKEETEKDNIPD